MAPSEEVAERVQFAWTQERRSLTAEAGRGHQRIGRGDRVGPGVAEDRELGQADGLAGGDGQVVGPLDVVARDVDRRRLDPGPAGRAGSE